MGALALILILEHVYNYSRYLQVIITQNSKPKTDPCISTKIFHCEVLYLISGSVHDQTRNQTQLHILWLQVIPHYKQTSGLCDQSSYFKHKKEIAVATASERQQSGLFVCLMTL